MNSLKHYEGSSDQELYLNLLKKCLTASLYDESAWRIIEAGPMSDPSDTKLLRRVKNRVRRLLVQQFRRRSILLVRHNRFNLAAREEGTDWPCFGFTMVGHRRLDNLQKCISDVLENNVPGDLIETGAWRGGASIFMRAVLKARGVMDRVVWVADSFQGLPPPQSSTDGNDLSDVEYLQVSLEQVKANFAKFGLLDEQVRFLPGWFKDTLPKAPVQKLAILRLDGDLYSSTMDALENLYSKVSRGGYVIVDDYFSWPECKRAVDDFLARKKFNGTIQKIDFTGVYWQVKD